MIHDHIPELRCLLELLCEGRANEGELARIEELAQSSSPALQFYVEYLDQHAQLLWRFRRFSSELNCDFLLELNEEPTVTDVTADTQLSHYPGDRELPVEILLNGRQKVGTSPILKSLLSPLPALTLAATGLIVAMGLWFVSTSRKTPDSTAYSKAHGRVNSVRLDSGVTTLSLDKIGTVIVEGPADFELISPMRARLMRGRIRMNVTDPAGHGFVVETPRGDVTDLGTEFGIDVASNSNTGVVVFQGAVDLSVDAGAGQGKPKYMERLQQGEGLTVNAAGELDRMMSIVTGKSATFQPGCETPSIGSSPVILQVTDSLRTADTKKFYEIVPEGLQEDSLAYADRPEHEWNGMTTEGIPSYLVGADYVKTFCDDKMRTDMEIKVTLGRPAKLYVLYDEKLKPPKWLESGFRKTRHIIGRDLGKWPGIERPVERAAGPGNSIDHLFSIWERIVKKPGVVRLGANGRLGLNGKASKIPHMYGIAAIPLKPDRPAVSPPVEEIPAINAN